MTADDPYSRPLASAAALGDAATDRMRFADKQLLLTGEAATLATANGEECLIAALLLLFRICRSVTVALPPGTEDLDRRCRALARAVEFGRSITFTTDPDLSGYDAILSIGTQARADLPWTVINANGWLARVSSTGASLPADCHRANPVAALGAASLGVAEVFKRLIVLREGRGKFWDGLSFSLFSYKRGDDPGPDLPDDLRFDLLLAGAGAIGNGVIHLLDRLAARGKIWIVDRQAYGPENLGTCLRIGPGDVGVHKAKFAADLLGGRYMTRPLCGDLDDVVQRISGDPGLPAIVVGGLDNVEARYALQKLWPDLVVDGAIGANFGCQVSRHPWGEDVACLMCLFARVPSENAQRIASRATGLSEARSADAEAVITDDDVHAAPPEMKEWLAARRGRKICSVVQEGVAEQLSRKRQKSGFTPSVPFVACLSASMIVAEVIKHVAGWRSHLAPRFQFDALQGPHRGLSVDEDRRAACMCVERNHAIERFRSLRMRGPSQ